MPIDTSFHIQQSCCTNANSEQPFWPRYTTATHQPHMSMSRSTHSLNLLRHRLTYAAKHLCHCMLVNQLQHMTPSKNLGSCYCDMHPTMGQLSSMHQQSFHVLLCVPSGTTATLQALTRHHFLVAQPALPPPTPCMQPTSTAPATLATQMKQASAVPIMPAVHKNALAPMPATSHATPVQP